MYLPNSVNVQTSTEVKEFEVLLDTTWIAFFQQRECTCLFLLVRPHTVCTAFDASPQCSKDSLTKTLTSSVLTGKCIITFTTILEEARKSNAKACFYKSLAQNYCHRPVLQLHSHFFRLSELSTVVQHIPFCIW